LNDCKELLANPIDSFKTQYNDAGRLENFKRISSFGSDLTAALEFAVVLRTVSTETPTWYGGDFNPGEYKGKLLLHEYSNQKLLAVVDLQAGSSNTASAQNFADHGKAAAADYLEHINTSIKEALSSNFEITGKPSQLQ
jgi:hypothetical protein